MPEFRKKIVCRSCRGTGLYKGFAESGKCAVVCHTCDGTGCEELIIKYEEFKERRLRAGVTRVFKDSCGYGHTDRDLITEEGKLIEFSKGGCTYEEWLEGADPKPVEDLYCPFLWERQDLRDKEHKAHKLYKEKCDNHIRIGYRISECTCNKDPKERKKCWERYHQLMK